MSPIIYKIHHVVFQFRQDPQGYLVIKQSDCKPRLALAIQKQLLRCAKTGNYTVNKLVQKLELPIMKKSVQAILKVEDSLQYRRLRNCVYLSLHIQRTIQWAVKHLSMPMSSWERLVWSDDKKFNLDGPDKKKGSNWHDLQKDAEVISMLHTVLEYIMN